jgi:hypothetical protein
MWSLCVAPSTPFRPLRILKFVQCGNQIGARYPVDTPRIIDLTYVCQ